MERASRGKQLAGAVLALLLVSGVVALVGPIAVWRLLLRSDPGWLGAALAVTGLTSLLRGARLQLLLPPARISLGRIWVVAAAAQAAMLFLPLRLGELVLPWLLRRAAAWDLAAGLGTLLAARAIDLATLGAWAGASVLLLWGVENPLALVAAAALLVPPLLLPVLLAATDRLAVRLLAPVGLRWRRWARRVRRLRRSLDGVRRRPARLLAAIVTSLAIWGSVWLSTWLLLLAMGLRWPLVSVVAGSAAASLANILPINLVANLGTLEAGWTAAFTALGVPLEQAAASGLAAHLWALVFAALYGGCAWVILLLRWPHPRADGPC